jgi:hypothetical protein
MCDEATLTKRARRRDENASPRFMVLEETRVLANTVKIDTANKNPETVVDEILSVIQSM